MTTLKSAFKAYTFNKLSDVSLLIAIFLIYIVTFDTNIQNVNLQIKNFQNLNITLLNIDFSYIELLCFFLLISAFIKSAQFGTHT
jgi:NADH:ubiquinone oxidoreductase subunit 5 (subunit L)/multisubunit Na+/H+ antiporter MnhA subunit